MDPQLARNLFEHGATLVMLDFPIGAEFGIDMNCWKTSDKFLGVKMIPPGIHFVYFSEVSKEGQVAPRTGFFHNFASKEVLVKQYDKANEDIISVIDDRVEKIKNDLKNIDNRLGAYPYDSWKKWVSLTNRISPTTLSRLEPRNGKILSVSEVISDADFKTLSSQQQNRNNTQDKESAMLPEMRINEESQIRYTPLPDRKYPPGSSPSTITKYNMDSSYQLRQYFESLNKKYEDQVSSSMKHVNEKSELLGELQFSFICFLVGQNFDSFEYWKKLLNILCKCDEDLATFNDLFNDLITDLHFQIREVPDDFFVDILSKDNFLVSILTHFFSTIKSHSSLSSQFVDKAKKFENNLSKKFNWNFENEQEDELPVIVDL